LIVTLSHQKGGVGKSTIAWNLAANLASVLPVSIVDLDTQRSLTVTNAIRAEHGMAPFEMLHFSNAGELAAHIEADGDDRLSIIDSGGFDSAFNRLAIVASDLLITPVSDKPFDLMGLQKYEEILKTLSQIQGATLKTHVVFNNLNPALRRFGDIVEFVCMSEHFELMTSVLRQRVDLANSVGVGKSIKEYRRFGRADQEFDGLTQEVRQHLGI